jgi:hypothetical protein
VHGEDSDFKVIPIQLAGYNPAMPLPLFNLPQFSIHITGSVVAAYGAVLSTITAAVQVVNHFRDRVKLKVRVQHGMEIIGDPRYKGMPLTIVYVTNVGRRPVTVTSVGAYRLHPALAFVIPDTNPKTPCELTEGKQMLAMFDESDVDQKQAEAYEAYTAIGRTFRNHYAPWYRRWLSKYRRRKQWKREQKEKEKHKQVSLPEVQ